MIFCNGSWQAWTHHSIFCSLLFSGIEQLTPQPTKATGTMRVDPDAFLIYGRQIWCARRLPGNRVARVSFFGSAHHTSGYGRPRNALNHLGTTGHQWVEATRFKNQASSLDFAFLVGLRNEVIQLGDGFKVCMVGTEVIVTRKRVVLSSTNPP
jgi:hypothetical protein